MKIKLGCMQWSFRKPIRRGEMDTFEFIEAASQLGFSGVELLESFIEGDDAFFIGRLVSFGKSKNVELISIGVENTFSFPEKEKRKAEIRRVENWIRIANLANIPIVRVATSDVQPKATYDQQVQWVTDGLKECADYAEKRNITLALENHSSVCASADELIELIEKVNSKSLKICLDPYNFTWAYRKENSTSPLKFNFEEFGESFYAETKKLAPLAVLTHAKFSDFDKKGAIVGMDYERILQIYKSVNFEGYMSLEYYGNEEPWKPLEKARSYLEDLIRRI